jgi:predicted PurR-regulated permease PerM
VEHYSVFYRRTFMLATVVALGFALSRLLAPLWSALEWAAVLAFLLYPLHVRITHRFAGRATVSAGLLTGLTPFVIIAPISTLGIVFAHQVSNLIAYLHTRTYTPLPDLLDQVRQYPLIGPAAQWIQANVAVNMQQLEEWATESARAGLQSAASLGGNFVLGVAGTLFGFFLMLFLLFFLLRDGRSMLAHVIRLIPLEEEQREHLVQHLATVLRAVVFGTAATAVIQGALIGVGFAFVGLPSPVVFGVLAVLAAFIPVVGTSVILVPAVLYLAIVGRWGATTFLVIWIVLINVAEQLLRPMLSARHGSVSTLAVFVGALGGVAAFGLIGIVIGPVILSLVVALVQLAEQRIGSQRP